MEKEKKKPYVRPVCTCTVLTLESQICTGSDFIVKSPHGGAEGIKTQPIDTNFEGLNDFTATGWE